MAKLNKSSYASEFARKGGKARARKLTAAQRTESAKKAARARWDNGEKRRATVATPKATLGS